MSSRESDSDSGHESDPGDKVNAESSDATRPKKKQRQAKPDIEPDLEFSNEIEDIVAQVAQGKEKLAKKQGLAKLLYDIRRANTKPVHDVDNMEKMEAGKSFKELDKMNERYGKLIKDFNKNRKNGFEDFELAWNETCPGYYASTRHALGLTYAH